MPARSVQHHPCVLAWARLFGRCIEELLHGCGIRFAVWTDHRPAGHWIDDAEDPDRLPPNFPPRGAGLLGSPYRCQRSLQPMARFAARTRVRSDVPLLEVTAEAESLAPALLDDGPLPQRRRRSGGFTAAMADPGDSCNRSRYDPVYDRRADHRLSCPVIPPGLHCHASPWNSSFARSRCPAGGSRGGRSPKAVGCR